MNPTLKEQVRLIAAVHHWLAGLLVPHQLAAIAFEREDVAVLRRKQRAMWVEFGR